MKKLVFLFATALLILSACDNEPKNVTYYGGVTSASGENCFAWDYSVNPDNLVLETVKDADSDSLLVTLNLKFTRTEKEIKPVTSDWYLKISGRDDYKDVEIRLDADEASMKTVKDAANAKQGDEIAVAFKGKATQGAIDSIAEKKCWTGVLN